LKKRRRKIKLVLLSYSVRFKNKVEKITNREWRIISNSMPIASFFLILTKIVFSFIFFIKLHPFF